MVASVLALFGLLAVPAAADLFPDCVNGPLAKNLVCNTNASVNARAQALISAMHNDEKFNLTGNTSPGVPRLGLHSYQWWRSLIQPSTLVSY
jgi:xylan 1,4-beta-xylosidase